MLLWSGVGGHRTALPVSVFLFCSTVLWAQIPPARTIVLSGSEPAGQPPGVSFADVSPSMDPYGRIVIKGTLAGSVTSNNDTGLWFVGQDNIMVEVVQEGDAAPDLPGLTLGGFPGSIYPSTRGVGYNAFLEGDVTIYNNMASFFNGTLVHRFEDQAPGFAPGVTWDGAVTDVNAGGQLLVLGPLKGPGIDSSNDDILYRWSGGNFTQLLRLGDAADGGGTFADISVERGFNRNGIIAFRGAAENPPGVYTNGIWVGSDGSYHRAVNVGQTIATPTGSGILDLLTPVPVLDETSAFFAFTGSLTNGLKGLWIGNSLGVWRAVALENDQVGGYTIMDVGGPVIAEDSVAFVAYLAVVGQGVVLDTAAAQTLIAKGGDAPPGAPSGTEFDSFSNVAINSLGQVVFKAEFVGTESGSGIWLWTRDGELRPVAITGQPMWISPSDMRTPTALSFGGGSYANPGQGAGVALTDDGLILFTAIFSDGVKAVLTSDPENIGIWATGFETGDLTGWSSSSL